MATRYGMEIMYLASFILPVLECQSSLLVQENKSVSCTCSFPSYACMGLFIEK